MPEYFGNFGSFARFLFSMGKGVLFSKTAEKNPKDLAFFFFPPSGYLNVNTLNLFRGQAKRPYCWVPRPLGQGNLIVTLRH